MLLTITEQISAQLEAILANQKQILAILTAKRLELKIGARMANFQLGDNQKVPYTLILLDAQGNPAQNVPGDIPGVTSNDTTVIAVVPDATPVAGSVASGFLVAQGKIGAGIIITAVVQMPTGAGPNLTTSDTIDVVGGVPATLGFGLGTPIPIGTVTPPVGP